MNKIAIVTDTGAYLPGELIQEYGIYTVPFQLIWGNKTYRDVEDIGAEEFYSRLATAEIMPSTSQPPPIAFEELYRRLLGEDYEILGIHTSSKLSGTLDSATQAMNTFPGAPIQLVDSLTTSMELGFHVLAAARAARSGASLQECKKLAEEARLLSGVYFVVATLEFLRRGGRIGGATAILGQALDLKPILYIHNGTIEPAAKVRTARKALERLLDMVEEQIKHSHSVRLCAIHANAPQKAQELLEKAGERFRKYHILEAFTSGVSPAIGTHAGPGTAGLAYLTDM